MIEVWNCGGGRQSAAIAALIIQGRLPKPDWAIMADTGREKSSTWEYANGVLIPALAGFGVTLHIMKTSEYATCDLWSTNMENLLLPVFSNQSGGVGKMSNFCSGEWKKRVCERFLRAKGVDLAECRRWIGFSADEPKRIIKISQGADYKKGRIRLPLVLDVPMLRRDCAGAVKQMGWPPAPGSMCWMCPNQSDAEWIDLRENSPEEFLEAVLLERAFRSIDPKVFLIAPASRSMKWTSIHS